MVLSDGSKTKIFRDTAQFGYSVWYEVGDENATNPMGIGSTRKEALETLETRLGKPATPPALPQTVENAVSKQIQKVLKKSFFVNPLDVKEMSKEQIDSLVDLVKPLTKKQLVDVVNSIQASGIPGFEYNLVNVENLNGKEISSPFYNINASKKKLFEEFGSLIKEAENTARERTMGAMLSSTPMYLLKNSNGVEVLTNNPNSAKKNGNTKEIKVDIKKSRNCQQQRFERCN